MLKLHEARSAQVTVGWYLYWGQSLLSCGQFLAARARNTFASWALVIVTPAPPPAGRSTLLGAAAESPPAGSSGAFSARGIAATAQRSAAALRGAHPPVSTRKN